MDLANLVIFLFLASSINEILARDSEYCYSFEQDPYLYMGTKTAYTFVHGGRTRLPPVPNCTPVQIWLLSRHGTRYPSGKVLTQLKTLSQLRDQIIYNHENRGNGKLCQQDLDFLKNWQLDQDVYGAVEEGLTLQGQEDMRLLARRLQTAFPELLTVDAQNSNFRSYKFVATSTERTRSSLQSFVNGLRSNRNTLPQIYPETNDTLLQAFKNCPLWDESHKDEEASREVNKFIQGPEYQNLLTSVSQRLGFLYTINNVSVQVMYDMCRFDKAWHVNRISPWCSVFNRDELEILEYSEDLKYYYYAGPGRRINQKLGCPPLRDMFEHFSALEQGSNISYEPKGIFYFTHTVTLQAVMAALGLGKDATPLLAENYRSMSRRTFRTSLYGSFAGNIAAVFYRCDGRQSPFKVMFYASENPVLMEGCNVGLCDWDFIKSKYADQFERCTYNFCTDPNSASIKNNIGILSLTFIGFLLILRNNHLF